MLDMAHRHPPGRLDGEGYVVFNGVDPRNHVVRDFRYFVPIFPGIEKMSETKMIARRRYISDFKEMYSCPVKPRIFSRRVPVVTSYPAGAHIWKHEMDAEDQMNWLSIILIREKPRLIVCKVKYSGAYLQGWVDGGRVIVAKEITIIPT